jgi:hypothetical protein
MLNIEKVDGFRFINNLNTQVRSLAICTQIVKEIGNSHSSKEILKTSLNKWSLQLEDNSKDYLEHSGRLTIKKKATKAFDRYLEFINNLGLTNSINNVVSTTPIGFLLSNLLTNKANDKFTLTKYEQLFYCVELFRKDADAIILTLEMVRNSQAPSQIDLMKEFESNFKNRLMVKKSSALPTVQVELGDKFRTVEYQWKNAESYSEHIIIPRVEWLTDLSIITKKKSGKSTNYVISDRGLELLLVLPSIQGAVNKDVDENWLRCYSIKAFCDALNFADLKNWSMLQENERAHLLGAILEYCYPILSKGGAMRMPLYPLFLTIAIKAACDQGVIVEFCDLEEAFRNLKIGKRQYALRKTARLNESYVSVSLS